jgi:hypothetical protein
VGIPSEEGVMATAKVEREVEGPATKPNGHAVEGPTNGHALAAPGGELAELGVTRGPIQRPPLTYT